jgi:hypothetical protein
MRRLQGCKVRYYKALRGKKSLQLQGFGFAKLQRATKPYPMRAREFAKKLANSLYKYRQV